MEPVTDPVYQPKPLFVRFAVWLLSKMLPAAVTATLRRRVCGMFGHVWDFRWGRSEFECRYCESRAKHICINRQPLLQPMTGFTYGWLMQKWNDFWFKLNEGGRHHPDKGPTAELFRGYIHNKLEDICENYGHRRLIHTLPVSEMERCLSMDYDAYVEHNVPPEMREAELSREGADLAERALRYSFNLMKSFHWDLNPDGKTANATSHCYRCGHVLNAVWLDSARKFAK